MIVRPSRRGRLAAGLATLATLGVMATALTALAALAAPAALPVAAPLAPVPAGAAPAPAPGQAGGSAVRVAHFSPDTPRMDVYAAGFDGVESLVLPKLGFGEVSQYMRLPAGTYAFSMRPQGSPATSTAALRVSADLAGTTTYTFAVFGRSDSLETDLLTDDMTAPAAGGARVRIIQGAGDAGPVEVTTGVDELSVQGADIGTVGPYTTVPAGTVEVTVSADGVDDVTRGLDLAAGTVSSLVVLDEPADGGLQVVRVTDGTGTPGSAATPTGLPAGGIDTGGGSTASQRAGGIPVPAAVGVAAGGVTVAGSVWFAAVIVRGRGSRLQRRAG
jgi:hypothetical protein